MDTKYFSFFGEVVISPTRATKALNRKIDREFNKSEYLDMDYQEGEFLSIWRTLGSLPTVEWLGQDSSTTARVVSFQGRFFLVVENTIANWINWGEVELPLQFTAPAAIAGACCTPRYGLER